MIMESLKRGFLLLWSVSILTCSDGAVHSGCEGDDHYCIMGYCVMNSDRSYQCACHQGYYGDRCELRVCSPNPCQHGGTCQATSVKTYNCACLPGYAGNNCEVDGCIAKPCQNGGTCQSSSGGGYTCSCGLGYTGTNCELQGACNLNPCLNGGLCLDQPSGSLSYTCVCQSEYLGANCEIKPVCNPNPCLNGGICIKQQPRDQAYVCYCQSGFTGHRCENVPATTPSILSITTLQDKPATTAQPVTSTKGPQYGAVCDKMTIINDIASQSKAFSLDTPKCPSGSFTSPEAFVVKHCLSLGNPSQWRRGSNVFQSCMSNTTQPVYTPIGTFSGAQYNAMYSWSAIFLGCETDGFKVSIQLCDSPPKILHVRQGHTGFHADPSEYYWIVAQT